MDPALIRRPPKDRVDHSDEEHKGIDGDGTLARRGEVDQPGLPASSSAGLAYGEGKATQTRKDAVAEKGKRKTKDNAGVGHTLTRDRLQHHEALWGVDLGATAQEQHRAKRGITITPHSLFRASPMIAEMKGINALNLEPALPNLDDATRKVDWINLRRSQYRTTGQSGQGYKKGLKQELAQSLDLINRRFAGRSAGRRSRRPGRGTK